MSEENKLWDNYRTNLSKMAEVTDEWIRTLTILALIMQAMREVHDLFPILVGGRAVDVYTNGGYATHDTVLVMNGYAKAGEVLTNLGFVKPFGGRSWYREDLDFSIEIPDNTLVGDITRVIEVTISNNLPPIYVIGVEDLILDRIRACEFWNSSRDCEWATRLIALHWDIIDIKYLNEVAAHDKIDKSLLRILEDAKVIRSKLQ